MKTRNLLFLLLLSTNLSAQVVSNGNFETWGIYNSWNAEPQDWHTNNSQLQTPVTPDSAAYEGLVAMRVQAQQGFEGAVQQIAFHTQAIEYIPAGLHFAVKCNVPDVNPSDNVSVLAEFRNNGTTMYTEFWSSFISVDQWEMKTIVFAQIDVAVDEVRIHVVAGFTDGLGGGSADTWISVDDFGFDAVIPVFETDPTEAIQIWPNPFSDFIRINPGALTFSNTGKTEVLDMCGKVVASDKPAATIQLSGLPDGVYFLRIVDHGRIIHQSKIIKVNS